MSTLLVVDGDRCAGHARCYLAAAPDLLSPDEEGFVSIRGGSVFVPEEQFAHALAAVDSCPEHAISLQESEQGDQGTGLDEQR